MVNVAGSILEMVIVALASPFLHSNFIGVVDAFLATRLIGEPAVAPVLSFGAIKKSLLASILHVHSTSDVSASFKVKAISFIPPPTFKEKLFSFGTNCAFTKFAPTDNSMTIVKINK
ncbi:MAG TPA: hypothetical protein VK400_07200 [Pyrinomonadaceae bacterium]|nr:hypothetical protein [Pyrinomonadaceae bacterium]